MHTALHPLAFIGPGGPEILVVMLVLLLMFGAKDAPRIFRKISDTLNQLRTTAENFKREVMYSGMNVDSDPACTAGEYDDYGVGSADEPNDINGETKGAEATEDRSSRAGEMPDAGEGEDGNDQKN